MPPRNSTPSGLEPKSESLKGVLSAIKSLAEVVEKHVSTSGSTKMIFPYNFNDIGYAKLLVTLLLCEIILNTTQNNTKNELVQYDHLN